MKENEIEKKNKMEIEEFVDVLEKKVEENILQDEDEEYDEEDEEYDEDDMDNVVSSNGELVDPLKKKRGRKPKPKDEDEEKTQKKRGRKPKQRDENEIDDEKAPKKRGRKPKEKTYSVKEGVTADSTTVVEKTETVILHLPLKKEQEEIPEPSPYLKKNINYSMISNTYSVLENVDMTNVKMVPKKEEVEETEEKIELKNDYDAHYSFLDNDAGEEEDKIEKEKEKKVEEPVEETKIVESVGTGGLSYIEDDKSNKVVKKNLKNIMYEFVNSNSANTWPESTNTCCWWCCHTFEGMPCALPELYRKEKFYVSGVYCSFNCAASYNFSKNDGEDMWMRYSLLNLMYRKMFHGKFVKIGLAPPREVLKMFGGYMCIDEFRETSLRMDKTFNVIKPPMVAIIPKIEENVIHRGIRSGTTNEHILNKTQNNLKLKRTKPLMNPNSTLQSFMNIKIV